MSARPLPLLTRLEALGVMVALNEAGDGLKLSSKHRPPADLLDELRAAKPELLAALKAAEVVTRVDNLSPSSLSLTCEALPAHLAALVDTARWGQLPIGAVKLVSGIVTDLEGYVLAWAECWPRDPAHVLRRLEEAHAATMKP